jgi:hypothetical protein
MCTCERISRVSVHYWGRNSCERAGMLHLKGVHLDGLHYQHIFLEGNGALCMNALLLNYLLTYLLTYSMEQRP